MTTKESFQRAVAKAIGGDKNHGWGVEDSMSVIKDLLNDEALEATPECLAAIREVINPAQFHQKLSKADLLAPMKTRASKVKSMLADFKA